MTGTKRPDQILPRGAGAAHAAADLASHRSPSGASRDRGCRDLGRLAGVLPAGARSNLAHVASGPVSPGSQCPGPEGPGPERPGSERPGSERPGPVSSGSERPGSQRPGPVSSGPECSGSVSPGAECPGPVGPGRAADPVDSVSPGPRGARRAV